MAKKSTKPTDQKPATTAASAATDAAPATPPAAVESPEPAPAAAKPPAAAPVPAAAKPPAPATPRVENRVIPPGPPATGEFGRPTAKPNAAPPPPPPVVPRLAPTARSKPADGLPNPPATSTTAGTNPPAPAAPAQPATAAPRQPAAPAKPAASTGGRPPTPVHPSAASIKQLSDADLARLHTQYDSNPRSEEWTQEFLGTHDALGKELRRRNIDPYQPPASASQPGGATSPQPAKGGTATPPRATGQQTDKPKPAPPATPADIPQPKARPLEEITDVVTSLPPAGVSKTKYADAQRTAFEHADKSFIKGGSNPDLAGLRKLIDDELTPERREPSNPMRQHAAVAAYIQKYNQYAQEPLGYEYKDKLDELIKGTHRPAQGPQATRVAKALGLAESPNQDRPAATVPSQQKPSGAAAPPVPAKPATTAAKPVPARPVAQPAAQTAQPPSPKPTAPAVQLPFADEGGKLTGAMTRLSNATAEERTQLLDTLAPRLTRMLEETRKMSGQDPAAVDRAVRKIANGMALYKHYTNQDHPAFNDLVKAYPSAANPASPDPFADLDEAKTAPPLIGTTEADRKARKADPLRPRTDGERVMRWLAGAAGTAFRLGKKAATGGLALAEGGGNAIGKAGQWAGLIPRDEPEAEQADAAPQAQKPKPTAAGPLSPPLVHQNDLDSIQRIIAKRGSTEALMGKLERIGEGDPAKVADKLLTQLMDRVAAGQPATVAHTVNGESYQMRYTPAIATKPPQIVFAKVAPQTLPVEPLPPEELAPLEKAAGEVSEPGAIRPPKKAIEAAKGIEGGLKAALEARGFSDPADLRRAVGGAAQAIQWGKYNADDFAEMSTKGKVVQLGKLRGVLRVVEEDGKKKYKLSIPKVKPKESDGVASADRLKPGEKIPTLAKLHRERLQQTDASADDHATPLGDISSSSNIFDDDSPIVDDDLPLSGNSSDGGSTLVPPSSGPASPADSSDDTANVGLKIEIEPSLPLDEAAAKLDMTPSELSVQSQKNPAIKALLAGPSEFSPSAINAYLADQTAEHKTPPAAEANPTAEPTPTEDQSAQPQAQPQSQVAPAPVTAPATKSGPVPIVRNNLIQMKCSSCGSDIGAPIAAAGRRGRCPTCGSIEQIPHLDGSIPSTPDAKTTKPTIAPKPANKPGPVSPPATTATPAPSGVQPVLPPRRESVDAGLIRRGQSAMPVPTRSSGGGLVSLRGPITVSLAKTARGPGQLDTISPPRGEWLDPAQSAAVVVEAKGGTGPVRTVPDVRHNRILAGERTNNVRNFGPRQQPLRPGTNAESIGRPQSESPAITAPATPPVQPEPQPPAAGTTMAPEVVSPPVDEQPAAETPANEVDQETDRINQAIQQGDTPEAAVVRDAKTRKVGPVRLSKIVTNLGLAGLTPDQIADRVSQLSQGQVELSPADMRAILVWDGVPLAGSSQWTEKQAAEKDKKVEPTLVTIPASRSQPAQMPKRGRGVDPAEPLQWMPITEVAPYEDDESRDNPSSQRAISKYMDRLKNGEDVEPVFVREDPDNKGRYLLVDGHHRYLAHRKLGLTDIPVRILDPQNITFEDQKPATTNPPAPPKKPKGGTVARVRKPQGSKPVPPTTPPTTEPEPTPTAGNLPAPPDGIPGLKKPRDGYVMASDNRWYPPDTITQETDETPPPTRPTRARVVRKKGAKPAAAPGKPRASKQPPA